VKEQYLLAEVPTSKPSVSPGWKTCSWSLVIVHLSAHIRKYSFIQTLREQEASRAGTELAETFKHPPSGHISNRNFKRVNTVLAILVPVGNNDIASGSCAEGHAEVECSRIIEKKRD